MYEIKTDDVCEDFSKDKEMFDFSNYSAKLKYHDASNELFVGKTKDETDDVVIQKYVSLKSNMYSFLIDDCSEHKKANGGNKNVVG